MKTNKGVDSVKDIFETVKDLKKVHNNKKIELGKEY